MTLSPAFRLNRRRRLSLRKPATGLADPEYRRMKMINPCSFHADVYFKLILFSFAHFLNRALALA